MDDHLDEFKVWGGNLREESQVKKTDLDRLGAKTQNEKLEFDKLAKELHVMSKEICELRKMYEEVQSGLHGKELLFNQTSSVNEKHEADYNEKILKLEGENRVLVLSLDEAFAGIRDVEKKTAASSEEISGLKRLLSINQELNSETRKNASTDLNERDRYILKLEEESRISQDQLKRKNEQFCHLEDAHRKLQTLLQVSKLEWQKEKSSLLDEISSLQGTLNAQNSASEILESQLRMSNQALAHEVSRRNVLELEVLESRSKFENAFLKCQAEESELRNLVRKYEILAHEMNCKIQHLEQQNSDLLVSLKSNHEVQVNSNAASLDQDFKSAMISFAEKEVSLDEAFKETEAQKISVVEEKNQEISNWEQEMNRLCENVDSQEKSLLQSMHMALRPEETSKSEIQELRSQLEEETRCFENLLEALKSHKQALLEHQREEKIKKDNLLAQLEVVCQQIGLLCTEDEELMGMLGKLSHPYEEGGEPTRTVLSSDGVSNTFSLSRKSVQVNLDERVPLTELNVNLSRFKRAKEMD